VDFNLTREQTLIQKMVRAFTENEVKPIAAETDKTCEYPRENIEKLFHYGIMGMPKEYGGAGSDDLSAALAVEELSKVCASTGDIVATHNGLCCDPILRNGTGAQKQKYLRMLTEGHKVGAFALTEPNAGSPPRAPPPPGWRGTTTCSTAPRSSSPTAMWPTLSWSLP
jgi:butyryl-CoA dehydrogenase